jgi:hypothetical protein
MSDEWRIEIKSRKGHADSLQLRAYPTWTTLFQSYESLTMEMVRKIIKEHEKHWPNAFQFRVCHVDGGEYIPGELL